MKVGTSLVDRLDRKMWFVLILIGLLVAVPIVSLAAAQLYLLFSNQE